MCLAHLICVTYNRMSCLTNDVRCFCIKCNTNRCKLSKRCTILSFYRNACLSTIESHLNHDSFFLLYWFLFLVLLVKRIPNRIVNNKRREEKKKHTAERITHSRKYSNGSTCRRQSIRLLIKSNNRHLDRNTHELFAVEQQQREKKTLFFYSR